MIPDFTSWDTLEKIIVKDVASNSSNWLKLETFDVSRSGEAIWLDGFGLNLLVGRDHPEISRKSCQTWQKMVSGRGENGSLEFGRAGKAWDPSEWIRIGVSISKASLFPYLGNLWHSSELFSHDLPFK